MNNKLKNINDLLSSEYQCNNINGFFELLLNTIEPEEILKLKKILDSKNILLNKLVAEQIFKKFNIDLIDASETSVTTYLSKKNHGLLLHDKHWKASGPGIIIKKFDQDIISSLDNCKNHLAIMTFNRSESYSCHHPDRVDIVYKLLYIRLETDQELRNRIKNIAKQKAKEYKSLEKALKTLSKEEIKKALGLD